MIDAHRPPFAASTESDPGSHAPFDAVGQNLTMTDERENDTGDEAGVRSAKYGKLPPRVRPEDAVPLKATDPPRDKPEHAPSDTDWLLRQTGGG
jgi:hypothetical protein